LRIKVIDPVDPMDPDKNAQAIKTPAMALEATFTATEGGIFDVLT